MLAYGVKLDGVDINVPLGDKFFDHTMRDVEEAKARPVRRVAWRVQLTG
jgi:hypothetical protein